MALTTETRRTGRSPVSKKQGETKAKRKAWIRSWSIKKHVHQGTERRCGCGRTVGEGTKLETEGKAGFWGPSRAQQRHIRKTPSRGRGVHKKDNRSRHVESSECGAGMLHRTTHQWGVNSARQEEARRWKALHDRQRSWTSPWEDTSYLKFLSHWVLSVLHFSQMDLVIVAKLDDRGWTRLEGES